MCPPHSLQVVECTTDASGSWGCRAWHNTSWFQVPWENRAGNLSIAAKELVPIILACAAWGRFWHACRVRCKPGCGGSPAVKIKQGGQGVMHLLRCLVFVEAQIGCQLWEVYIDTHSNHLADDLSRDKLFSFLSKMSAADSQPTPTCPQLLSLLLNPQADWVSEQWHHQFSAIFSKV